MTSTEPGTLRLPASVDRTLRERAARGAPEEVRGVLVGDPDPEPRPGPSADASDDRPRTERATRAVRVENVAPTPETRYELDPPATVDAIDAAAARGERVVGFYHSHPSGPPEPSATDREAATWTGYVHRVVVPNAPGSGSAGEDASGGPGAVAAYRWTGAAFDRLRVETETP